MCERSPHEGNTTCPTLSSNRHWRPTGDRIVNADVCQNAGAVLRKGPHRRGGGGRGVKHGLLMFLLVLLAMGAAGAGLWFAWTRLGLSERVPVEWQDSAADLCEWVSSQCPCTDITAPFPPLLSALCPANKNQSITNLRCSGRGIGQMGEKLGAAKLWVESKLNIDNVTYERMRADFQPLADAADEMHIDEQDAEAAQPQYFIQ